MIPSISMGHFQLDYQSKLHGSDDWPWLAGCTLTKCSTYDWFARSDLFMPWASTNSAQFVENVPINNRSIEFTDLWSRPSYENRSATIRILHAVRFFKNSVQPSHCFQRPRSNEMCQRFSRGMFWYRPMGAMLTWPFTIVILRCFIIKSVNP